MDVPQISVFHSSLPRACSATSGRVYAQKQSDQTAHALILGFRVNHDEQVLRKDATEEDVAIRFPCVHRRLEVASMGRLHYPC
jgi:hypothetical protein